MHSLDLLLWGMLQKLHNFIPESHHTCRSVIISSSSRICCPQPPANRIYHVHCRAPQRGGSSGPQGPFNLVPWLDSGVRKRGGPGMPSPTRPGWQGSVGFPLRTPAPHPDQPPATPTNPSSRRGPQQGGARAGRGPERPDAPSVSGNRKPPISLASLAGRPCCLSALSCGKASCLCRHDRLAWWRGRDRLGMQGMRGFGGWDLHGWTGGSRTQVVSLGVHRCILKNFAYTTALFGVKGTEPRGVVTVSDNLMGE
jgi:hypothetical protein